MKPVLTLQELFGRRVTYNPNASYRKPGWMQGGRAVRDFRTGDHFAVAGDLSYVCSRSVCAPAGLDLLADIGLDVPKRLEVYHDEESYSQLLSRLDALDRPMVFQHVHPEEEFRAAGYDIDRELLCRLNDKGNLQRFVRPEHLPARRTFRLEDLSTSHSALSKPPIVLKAATRLSSGGGHGVRLCLTPRDVDAALRHLAPCESVVVEEFLEIDRSPCLQFAASPELGIRYLGAAEQVTTRAGRYVGNWLDDDELVPDEVVRMGRGIMERAVAEGFHGIAGFDVAFCHDGRCLVIDLNFRLNGCTGPVLLRDAARERLAEPVIRYRSWESPGCYAELLRSVRSALGAGRFLPLCTYDPARVGADDERPRVSGLVAGASRQEVEEQMFQLAQQGLC